MEFLTLLILVEQKRFHKLSIPKPIQTFADSKLESIL